jgi:cytidyltransferase-like protein
MGKRFSKKEIKEICERERRKGKIIVFTNGCFDILHPGHIRLFKFAKSKGDILVVGINTDSSRFFPLFLSLTTLFPLNL